MDKYEDLESSLDPHRSDERRAAAAEVVAWLRRRGIVASDIERSEDLADLQSAVERFEAVVEAHGGDLMVDDLKGSQPDDRHFVLPRRASGEAIRAYIGRIDDATTRLQRHAPHPD